MNINNKDICFSCINPMTLLLLYINLQLFLGGGNVVFSRIVRILTFITNQRDSSSLIFTVECVQILFQMAFFILQLHKSNIKSDESRSSVAAAPPSGDANIAHKPEVFMKSFWWIILF